MARKSDIQYIRLYIDGNAARQYELPPQPQKKTRQRPRPHRQKKIVLHVDFVAVAGMLVAGVMLIMMIAGMVSLTRINNEVARMESYLAELEEENQQLRQTYREGYDLEQVREEALEMGMIPVSRAETVTIQVETPEEPAAESTGSFWSFLAGLFA